MNHQIFERKLHLYLGIGMRGPVLVNKSHIPYGMLENVGKTGSCLSDQFDQIHA